MSMPQTWEQYVRGEDLPEECPACGDYWCDEDGTPSVPPGVEPFCSEACRDRYVADQERDDAAYAAGLQEDERLALEWRKAGRP